MIRMILIFVLMLASVYAESDPDRLRVSVEPGTGEPVWVGQQVLIPVTLFLADRQGKIAYAGDLGPFGFDPDSWEEAIKQQLATTI